MSQVNFLCNIVREGKEGRMHKPHFVFLSHENGKLKSSSLHWIAEIGKLQKDTTKLWLLHFKLLHFNLHCYNCEENGNGLYIPP